MDEITKMMFQAVYDSDVEKLEQAIRAGADVTAKDEFGDTPMQCTWDENIASVLIRAGAIE